MFRTLINLVVNIMAAFIRDRDARHKFRNKYKKKTKRIYSIKKETYYGRNVTILILFRTRINFYLINIKIKSFVYKTIYKFVYPIVSHDTICYTCITGNYEEPHDHCFLNPRWEYVCFTDNQRLIQKKQIGSWQIKPLVFNQLADRLNARWHKLHPHILFPNFNNSLYVDGNVNILTPFYSDLIKKSNSNLIMHAHPSRICIYKELDVLKKARYETTKNIDALIKKYKKEGLPEDIGLSATYIIIRKHNDPKVVNLMEQWWQMVVSYSKRDQASLMYLLWKNNFVIKSNLIEKLSPKNCYITGHTNSIRSKTILITGGAGFIGSTLADKLISTYNKVIVIDNFNNDYSPQLRENNIKQNIGIDEYMLYRGDIKDRKFVNSVFADNKVDMVVHLATKSDTKDSVLNALDYVNTNINGTANILEAMRQSNVKKIIFASSASVYGNCKAKIISEKTIIPRPKSPFTGTIITCEQMLYTYTKMCKMQAIILRLFDVYGPRQTPDMPIKEILANIHPSDSLNKIIKKTAFADYTYIDDVVSAIILALKYNRSKYSIFNIGSGIQISQTELITIIQNRLGVTSSTNYLTNYSRNEKTIKVDISKAKRLLGYQPSCDFEEGINKYIDYLNSNNNF